MYKDSYKPETEIINSEEWVYLEPEHCILLRRRKELHLTQQQVADAAGIKLRQYQRLESGERSIRSASLRIALLVCSVLQLDPHRFVPETTRLTNS